jgi:hypothetical protein
MEGVEGENKVVRSIFGLQREKLTGWRQSLIEGSVPDVTRIIKSS